jgi:periplasmic protein CpxP/Spy
MLNRLTRQVLIFAAGAALLTSPVLSQSVEAFDGQGGARMERGLKELNLTEAQKTQVKALREAGRIEMERILTPDQQATLKAAKGKGGDRRSVMQSLNLTDAQKNSLKAFREKQRQSFEAILTPDQKAKLDQKRSEMKARYGNKKPAA